MDQDPPMLNTTMEDALAHAATEAEREMVLDAWLRLGAEHLARQAGRKAAREKLKDLDAFLREARPHPDWPT